MVMVIKSKYDENIGQIKKELEIQLNNLDSPGFKSQLKELNSGDFNYLLFECE